MLDWARPRAAEWLESQSRILNRDRAASRSTGQQEFAVGS